jgi:hypothetical protein
MKANKRIALLLGFLMAPAWAEDKPVGITAQQTSMDVMHEGKLVRIQREQDKSRARREAAAQNPTQEEQNGPP